MWLTLESAVNRYCRYCSGYLLDQHCALHWGNVKENVCCCSPECCKADNNGADAVEDDALHRVVDVSTYHRSTP